VTTKNPDPDCPLCKGNGKYPVQLRDEEIKMSCPCTRVKQPTPTRKERFQRAAAQGKAWRFK